MTDFDHRLKEVLSAEDQAFVTDTIDETGYYRSVFQSFRGQGASMRITSWVGILVASAALIYCVIQMFLADTLQTQIIFATFAIMLNGAQIGLKIWFNMQIDRRAIIHEIKRLQLVAARDGH